MLAVLLAASALHVNGQCTQATCPPGPVDVAFTSSDCSGSPSFYSHAGITPMDVCISEGSESYKYDTTASSVTRTSFNNPTCTRGLVNETSASTTDIFYVCKPATPSRRDLLASASSYMVLPNVNATYPSPQSISINLNYLDYNDIVVHEACAGPNDCSRNGVNATVSETESDSNCVPTSSSAIYNVSYDGTCYRQGTTFYSAYRCVDAHTQAVDYYVGDGCQHLFHSEAYRRVCSASSSITYHCRATPVAPITITPPSTPSNPSAAPSAASIIIPSSLFLLSIVALLF